jgi:hypothetical protein
VVGDQVLEYAPSYRLDPIAASLFGGERIWQYQFDFPSTDRKLLALEYYELGTCVRDRVQPEVTGEVARAAVALVYALFEADRAGRPVTLDEVESGALDAYQREIDEHLRLRPGS